MSERGESTERALLAAQRGAEAEDGADGLAPADHEALIALTLGEEVSSIDEDERREAEDLRRALEGRGQNGLAELAGGLRAVHCGMAEGGAAGALGSEDHEALIALTLGEAASRPAPEEGEAAGGLRRGLDGEGGGALVELALAARAAAGRGRPLDELSAARLLRDALRRGEATVARRRSARRVAIWGAAAGGLVALAAGLALLVGQPAWLETRARPQAARLLPKLAPRAAWLHPRSTAALFDPLTPFAAKGGESDRLSRIVASRAADLRANRFAAWGVP